MNRSPKPNRNPEDVYISGLNSIIPRADFCRVARVTERDLDKLVGAEVVQKFANDNSRKGKYFLKQALQVRENLPVTKVDWPHKSGKRR